jgi:hypothetical protein
MPELPRDDHELPIDPWTLEGLLAEERLDVDLAAPGVSELATLVAAARTPAHGSELVGESAAVAAFITARDGGVSSTSTRHRRTSVLSTLIGSKLALAAAAGAVTLGGVSAAAFTGTLPDGAQALAHRVVGAPAAGDDTTTGDNDADALDDEATQTATATETATDDPTETGQPTATPVGPDATGPAAFGLCTAYAAQMRSGHTPDPASVAFRNLAAAAGGADNVTTYCNTVVTARATAGHPTGSPTTHPTKAPATHPTGSPTTHPGGSGDPSHASDRTRPTGSPTTHPGR